MALKNLKQYADDILTRAWKRRNERMEPFFSPCLRFLEKILFSPMKMELFRL